MGQTMTMQVEAALFLKMAEHILSPWRPGETAPKDGRLFLGIYKGCYAITNYEDDFGWCGDGICPSEGPDYWLPLPAMPSKERGYAWGK